MRGGQEARRRPRGHGTGNRGRDHSRRSILERIEDKLDRLLGGAEDRDTVDMFAPGTLTWDEGDSEPRILGGPHVSALGWDPGFAGPRFDRVDVGSVGTHAVHPVSSVDGAYGIGTSGYRSSARDRYLLSGASRHAPDGGGPHHQHYANWRKHQIEAFDRDFEEFCKERHESFSHEFDEWRAKRQSQADALVK